MYILNYSRYILQHQSILDTIACVLSVIIHLTPGLWHVSNYYLESVICYVW